LHYLARIKSISLLMISAIYKFAAPILKAVLLNFSQGDADICFQVFLFYDLIAVSEMNDLGHIESPFCNRVNLMDGYLYNLRNPNGCCGSCEG
jgi:hypothetical protein